MGFESFQAGGADSTLAGAYVTLPTTCMVYGRGFKNKLPQLLSDLGVSKAFIITGKSLREKTPVIADLENVLGRAHAGTYSGVRQHAPIADIQAALSQVQETGADVLISVGGGSPIDSAKVVAYHIHRQTGNWIPSIAIPTTLSVAETTGAAGYTSEDGRKIAVADQELAPKAILYDGDLALHTPMRLWLSSGIAKILPYVGKQTTGDWKRDAHLVGDAIGELVEDVGLKSTLTEYNVGPEEEEAIATRALGGDKSHPDLQAVRAMVRGYY
ncbi:predicted protein [Uncinocarpus reesii 1704]|uniref:Alcohol dehydrogenase iron-type/glycerol dehydrogenase GldA domain-containing protein n=1 Tax=Uncinocarpus reesii (strain UAMH 1704) TaxID=336963 RepID=C4JVG4_UNCRE|nr:uncharacterized protein UREG_06556 [Uncinocarpus reesii 1704]EEP81691.1 predicted protein [Uncinocarpus reesii 1704]